MYHLYYIPPPSTVHLLTILVNLSQMLVKAERALTPESCSSTHRPKHFCGMSFASQHCSRINQYLLRMKIRKPFIILHQDFFASFTLMLTWAEPIDACFCLSSDTFAWGSSIKCFPFFESGVLSYSVSTADRTFSYCPVTPMAIH